jgi:hypothetical protein
MKTSKNYKIKLGVGARTLMTALALATVLTGLGPTFARADDHRDHWDHGRDRGGDRGHHQQWNHRGPNHRGYVYEHPQGYYMAPPPVYSYQPPPPPPAVEFVFPLHLR